MAPFTVYGESLTWGEGSPSPPSRVNFSSINSVDKVNRKNSQYCVWFGQLIKKNCVSFPERQALVS